MSFLSDRSTRNEDSESELSEKQKEYAIDDPSFELNFTNEQEENARYMMDQDKDLMKIFNKTNQQMRNRLEERMRNRLKERMRNRLEKEAE